MNEQTIINHLIEYIESQIEEANSQGTYKHDWLYEDILRKIEELRKV